MKKIMKLIVAAFLIVNSLNQSFAQSSNSEQSFIHHTINVGFPLDAFDTPDLGLYAGYNFHAPINQRFSAEGQVSFSYSKFERDSDFFAHDGGKSISVNLLVGSRFYILKEDKNVRPYINALIGYNYSTVSEYRNDILLETTFNGIGLSAGAYLEIKERFNIGAGLESVGNEAALILKMGYSF